MTQIFKYIKKKNIYILLLSSLTLIACQKIEDTQNWVISNNSSTEIYIESDHINDSATTMDTIQAGDSKTIYYDPHLGTGEDLSSATAFMKIKISNLQDTLSKNEHSDANWVMTSEELDSKGRAYAYDYTFSVVDSDF